MKTKQTLLLLIFILLFINTESKSQSSCLSGYNWFRTQNDIDKFLVSNPSCTTIEGSVSIKGFNGTITNLNAFKNIDSIKGGLQIRETKRLNDITGLNNLKYTGDFYVQSNDSLTDFLGLDSLNKVGGGFFVGQNPLISSFAGLNNIDSVGGDFRIRDNPLLESIKDLKNLIFIKGNTAIRNNDIIKDLEGLDELNSTNGYIWISNNKKLENLESLKKLNSIDGYISIFKNESLKSLSGIQNINSQSIKSNNLPIEDIRINSNENLSDCKVKSICDFLELANKTYRIHENASGCNSVEQIKAACKGTDNTIEFESLAIDIYPNPSIENIFVDFKNTDIYSAEIYLLDMSGKIILSRSKTDKESVIELSTEDLNSGFYIVKIKTGRNKVFFKKAIIQY